MSHFKIKLSVPAEIAVLVDFHCANWTNGTISIKYIRSCIGFFDWHITIYINNYVANVFRFRFVRFALSLFKWLN